MAKNYICTLTQKLRRWIIGSTSKEKETQEEIKKLSAIKEKEGWKFYSANNKLIKVSYCAYYTIRIMDGFFANKITILTQGIEHNVSSDKAKNFCFDKEILDQLPEKCFSGFGTGEHYMHEVMYATEEDLK